ncbi:hypothetical protein AWM79_01835 [Pseudomonas agarici]|uniref:Lipid A biosynthesis acyltransferase n=2 Tax=Pseudomonas agarici TaxID=46677 RepID=A0A0X1SW13_PSEAA|nr:hypothetical protein AWM79_01835 [Pseudomonas agarici]
MMARGLSGQMKRWLFWALLKARLRRHGLIVLAQLFRVNALRGVLARVPVVLMRLPRRWRGVGYSRSYQNLQLFDLCAERCRILACQHSAIQLQRGLYQHLYQSHKPAHLRAWIRSIAWSDPGDHWQRSLRRRTIIALPHCGEYWMAVAGVVERRTSPTRFIIPIWNFRDPFTHGSIKHLEGLGHVIEVLDSNDPRTALAIARGVKRGDQVIIFCDLPVSLGGTRFGEPMAGRFFGRDAQFVKGPLFLASKLGCDLLLVGHRVRLGQRGELRVLERIAHGPLDQMLPRWAEALEGFLREAPQNWLYLPEMEAFYQRQASSSEQRQTDLSTAIRRH